MLIMILHFLPHVAFLETNLEVLGENEKSFIEQIKEKNKPKEKEQEDKNNNKSKIRRRY